MVLPWCLLTPELVCFSGLATHGCSAELLGRGAKHFII